jgi:catechol 2,3-dioxygenase-like lactoylglutathione lyase family enzyme
MYPFTFDHIHYKSQNFDETRKFYVDLMGATDHGFTDLGKEGSRTPNLQLELAGITLFFAEDSKASTEDTEECGFPCNVPPWTTRHGVYHIALLVENCDDATAFIAKKADEIYGPNNDIIALEPFMAGDGIRASFLKAPDGMAIELKEDMA